MENHESRRLEAISRVIKAMAHPTRLYLMEILSVGERCVADLTELVGNDISTVSKHLSVLKSAGLVSIDKRGTQVFYSLKATCIMKCLTCVEGIVEAQAKETLDCVSC